MAVMFSPLMFGLDCVRLYQDECIQQYNKRKIKLEDIYDIKYTLYTWDTTNHEFLYAAAAPTAWRSFFFDWQ